MDAATLERDWRAALTPLADDGDTGPLLGFFEDAALFVDEDNPFVLDRAGFDDHMRFHASGIWDHMVLRTQEQRFDVFGTTGLVSCLITRRGKPRDGGFRQRHGVGTFVCHWDETAGRWRGTCLHLSTLLAHTNKCSPT